MDAEKLIYRLKLANKWVAVLIGGLLLACAVFVLLDIIMRQAGSSFGGTDEISGYVMAIVTSWGMAYTLLELGHVRIDLLRTRGGKRVRSLFDLGACCLLALTVTVTIIAWRCWPVLERSIANMSHANTPLETPLWLVQTPWFAGWAWFAIVSWLTLISAITLIVAGRFDQSEKAIGTFGELDQAK